MFPPVEDAVLQQNPEFAKLYGKLTNVILNPDGSTKEDPEAKERAAVREELEKRRLKAAKHHLLTHAISTTVPDSPSTKPSSRPRAQQQPPLPDPLIDLLLILPSLLSPSTTLSQDDLTLLFSHPPLSSLETLLPSLTPLLSSTIRSSALSLTRLTHPSTNPSYLHRHIASLPHAATSLREALATAEAQLTAARLTTLSSLPPLLGTHAAALAQLTRAVEAKHTVVARSLELRAADAAATAQRQAADAALAAREVRAEVYTPETVAALRNYAAHLRDARVRTEERVRQLEAELGEYGVGVEGGESKERVMREMARVYREMGRQMEDVKRDLDRLKKA